MSLLSSLESHLLILSFADFLHLYNFAHTQQKREAARHLSKVDYTTLSQLSFFSLGECYYIIKVALLKLGLL